MKRDDESFEEKTSGEEELLNFEFDELSEKGESDVKGDSSDDEEIIELIDIVEDEETLEDSESEEIARLLDEDESVQKELTLEPQENEVLDEKSEDLSLEFSDGLQDLDMTVGEDEEESAQIESAQAVEDEATESLHLDLDSTLESFDIAEEEGLGPEMAEAGTEGVPAEAPSEQVDSLETTEAFHSETPEPFIEDADEGIVEEGPEEEISLEFDEPSEAGSSLGTEEEQAVAMAAGAALAAELPEEDFSEILETTEEGPRFEEGMVAQPPEGSIGISEERLEEIITKVVQDVVEKVARETMASVAERVITEAIDALKQSLEVAPD